MHFSIGDRVRLKSGGPVMTIEEISGDDISCVWFDNAGVVVRNIFNPQTIETAAKH